MDTTASQQDFKSIYRRRKGIFLKSFLVIFGLAVGIALFLPSTYRSEVEILVENREIPEEYVKSTIKTFVNQRMQMISQQVMRPEKLMDIINKLKLYPNLISPSEKLRHFIKDVQLTPVEQSVLDEQRGKFVQVITAFTLSFDGKDPLTVQTVADMIANLYIEEDKRLREKAATSTPEFFEKELENLKSEILRNEAKISQFKVAHIDVLPGSLGTILQTIGRQEQELDRINTTIRTLREKKYI